MPDTASASAALGTPFETAIEFLQRKLDLPTERWNDIWQSAHDRAFIVAGAAKADLLQDLHRAVIDAARDGGLRAFREQFDEIVARNGWTGWTGEGSDAGVAWRTSIIYRTNMSASYAAGRWQQLTEPAFAKQMPYWRYRHADGVAHPRPEHEAWDGLTLPQSHPFWATHYPPNGWLCHCRVFAEQRPADGAPTTPPPGWDQTDPATGAPPGIDPGFAYAPGASTATPLRDMIEAKLLNLEGPIGRAMMAELEPVLAREGR